jgi:hypothetical protein
MARRNLKYDYEAESEDVHTVYRVFFVCGKKEYESVLQRK